MNNKTGVYAGFLIVILFASCQRNSAPAESYFDSLVVAQVAHLTRDKASLLKHASLDGREDQFTFIPDSSTWENELAIFRQLAAFEAPAYRSYYRIEDGIKDPSSNLSIRRYHTREKVPVRDLRFYYFNEFRNLKKIEGVYEQQNLLYTASRDLTLEFEEVGGKAVLTAYRINGAQQMIFGDSVRFQIRSVITN